MSFSTTQIFHSQMVALLGTGAMGGAIARGLLAARVFDPLQIRAFSRRRSALEAFGRETGVTICDSSLQAVQGAHTIILAVKPALFAEAVGAFSAHIEAGQTLISVAAGVSTLQIEAFFPRPVRVVRAMPNTPCLVLQGATGYCAGQFADQTDLERARKIFGALGLAVVIEEKQMDALTALSGSGPAFVFLMIEALADGGVRAGLPRQIALELAAQTVSGAAQMQIQTQLHPGSLKDDVASAGGTTIAGLHALERGGFRGAVMDAVWAATLRCRELKG